MEKETDSQSYDFTISWRTIFKILAGIVIALAVARLARFLEIIGLSVLLAIALRPIFNWTVKHKWPRWASVWLCAMIIFGGAGIVLATVVPLAAKEAGQVIKNIPEYKTNLVAHLPQSGPIKDLSDQLMKGKVFPIPKH